MIRSTHCIYLGLVLYFALLIGIAPINILSFDTYYYWDWSRHLALSYYDGSPMIAYFIKCATFLFGDTLFALNCVGISVAMLGCAIIYKTTRLFLAREASWVAALSWLFSPLVTLDILKQTTYDTPLALFWALTIYYTAKLIKTDKMNALYGIGISAGLMMLSKYTGIVLILALLIFVLGSRYRAYLKTWHFYCAILLAILIFSPVLIWNYQHQWQSFLYQLSTHQLNTSVNPFYNAARTFVTSFIPALNIMLLPPFLVSSKNQDEKNALIIRLCRIICFTFLSFYLYTAGKADVRVFWLTPYLISSAILFGYGYSLFSYRKLAVALIGIYSAISLFILLDNTSALNLVKSKKFAFYHLIQQFNISYPQQPDLVFTSGWFQARMLFFLKNKPAIYTLDCGEPQNQYGLWSAQIKEQIKNKTLKEALYIDRYDQLHCLKKYFDHCEKIPTSTYMLKHKGYFLTIYRCQNV